MATSKRPSRLLEYLGSSRNIAGSLAGIAALGATVPTGVSGQWWPVVVGGMYGIAALLVPERSRPPHSTGSEATVPAEMPEETAPGTAPGTTSAVTVPAEGTSALLQDNSPGGYGSWLTNRQILPAGREGDLDPPDRHENPSGRRP